MRACVHACVRLPEIEACPESIRVHVSAVYTVTVTALVTILYVSLKTKTKQKTDNCGIRLFLRQFKKKKKNDRQLRDTSVFATACLPVLM